MDDQKFKQLTSEIEKEVSSALENYNIGPKLGSIIKKYNLPDMTIQVNSILDLNLIKSSNTVDKEIKDFVTGLKEENFVVMSCCFRLDGTYISNW